MHPSLAHSAVHLPVIPVVVETSTGRNTPNGFPLFNRNGDGVGVGGKLTVLDISPLLAESIRRTHNGESISLLFGDWAERAGMAGY
jgi:hypothetical protein